jgi:hypothetical protein
MERKVTLSSIERANSSLALSFVVGSGKALTLCARMHVDIA